MLRRSLAVASRVAPMARVAAASRMAVPALTPATRLPTTSVFTTPRRFGGHGHHDSDEFEKLYKEMAMKAAVDPIQEGQRTDDAYTPGDNIHRLSGAGALGLLAKVGILSLISLTAVYVIALCDTDEVGSELSPLEREKIENLVQASLAKKNNTPFTPSTPIADAIAAGTLSLANGGESAPVVMGVKRSNAF